MITDKKILVVGSGVSGAGAVELLEKAGASPVLYDSNGKLTKEEVRGRLPEGSRAEIILGELPEQVKRETELVVLSPGVPVDLPLVEELRERGARIWGEVELAWHFGKGRVAAITGILAQNRINIAFMRLFREARHAHFRQRTVRRNKDRAGSHG